MKEVSVKAEIKSAITSTLEEHGLGAERIILFGSRARESYRKDSDWDILVITNRRLTRREKMEISRIIRKKLAELYIDCDLILKSKHEVELCKDLLGTVTREALKEGVLL